MKARTGSLAVWLTVPARCLAARPFGPAWALLPARWALVYHHDPKKSFHWGDRQFPLCARCTGIMAGYPIGFLLVLLLNATNAWVIGFCLNVPLYIDGILQANGIRESTNWRRLVTGMLSGAGQTLLFVVFPHVDSFITRRYWNVL